MACQWGSVGNMGRLTRAESQAQTRATLIVTARKMFFEKGFHATSLEKVADAAGFSKGAVYSNFRNKNELCIAVLEDTRSEQLATLSATLLEPNDDARLQRFAQWAERVVGDPAWTSLEVEFAMHARRDEQLRTELAARLDGILALLTAASGAAAGADPLIPLDEVAVPMLALGVGLGIFRSINPAIPVDGLVDVLRILTGVAPDDSR